MVLSGLFYFCSKSITMKQDAIIKELTLLFVEHFNTQPQTIEAFPHTASGRRYFRMKAKDISVIGAYGKDVSENRAFIYFSKMFKEQGINVPEIYTSKKDIFYIQEDLGNESLMDRNRKLDRKNGFPESLKELYQKAIRQLIRMQVHASKHLDYSRAYPKSSFDRQSMEWDLNYFKYYFLNVSGIAYDEYRLEKDFSTLVDFLQSANTNHFMFRDFQSRNIMIVNEEPYFIDYQGGRQGAVFYDLASLLFQSKANIPHGIRAELIQFHKQELSYATNVDKLNYDDYFYSYTIIRIIQVLGAYGKRGLIEKMPYFIQSIPLALDNIRWWLDHVKLSIDIPYLREILGQLTELQQFQPFDINKGKESPLTVSIYSFSYKEGIPKDNSGNGGGFVFDCRNIHNPGRYEPYKTQTGRDKPVQDFLLTQTEMPGFLENAYSLVDRAVENYIERGFANLQVSFGCTGGQHRSVFSADSLSHHLQEKYGVKTLVKHVVQERKNWINEPY